MTQLETPRFLVQPLDAEDSRSLHGAMFDDLSDVYGTYFPNSLRVMARDPVLLRALVDLGQLVMQRPGKVEIQLKWLVASVTSRAAGCRYCTAHTAGHGSNSGIPDEKIEQLWSFEESELFTERERAALRLGLAAGASPNAADAETFADLHRFFDDDEIIELMAVISYFGWWNRWNDTLAIPLDAVPLEFGNRHLRPSGWDPGRHAEVAQ